MTGPCYYFGCVREAGHYLFDERLQKKYSYDFPYRQLGHFDGALCYKETKHNEAALTRIWGLGYSALSFWDYSVDSRGGSNSNFFIPEMNATPEQLLHIAAQRFPTIFARLPSPVSVQRAIRDILGPEAVAQLLAKKD